MYELEIQKKIDAIKLSVEINNVAEAARLAGVSRQTIYRNRKILKEHGPQALKRTFRKDHFHKNRAPQNIENQIIAFSLENPHLGQAQVALQLNKLYKQKISPSGVRNVWLRTKMQTAALRRQKAAESWQG